VPFQLVDAELHCFVEVCCATGAICYVPTLVVMAVVFCRHFVC